MRHAGPTAPLSIGHLVLTMIQRAGFCSLVSPTRSSELSLPHSLPTGLTAIALAAVTATAEGKHRVAAGVTTPARAKAVGEWFRCHGLADLSPQYPMDDRTDDLRLRRG